MNADLHCHSSVSDGTLTPEALAARAKANGVELWALTDHDEVGGQQRARDAALALGLPYLTGTEISVTFVDITVHIVGLGFDADDAALKAGLAATRGGRRERALEMADGLAQAGIHGSLRRRAEVRRQPRPDLAHALRALPGRGRRVRRHQRGVPPLPHRGQAGLRAAPLGDPARRGALDQRRRRRGRDRPPGALQVHRQRGVRAVHRVQGARRPGRRSGDRQPQQRRGAALRRGGARIRPAASRGSDFHSPGESHTDLGALPDLPGKLTPVWDVLQDRIQRPQ